MAGTGTETGTQSISLQRLYLVEKRIVHALELAGGFMEELGTGPPRADALASQCREFIQSMKDIQTMLHEEIKGMCENRPYENCDYAARTGAEITVRKLECVVDQLKDMQGSIKTYQAAKTATNI